MHGEKQSHGGQGLLASREQVHVAEALRRRHRSELDAAVEGVLCVLQVQVCRASLRVEAGRVRREPLVDVADLPGDLREALDEALLPSLAHALELGLDVFDLAPRHIRVSRRIGDVLGDTLDLLDRLQVGAQPLQLDAQALQLRSVLVLQHLRCGAGRRTLLFLGQSAKVDAQVRCLRLPLPGLLRGRLRVLARRLRDVLQRLESPMEKRHLDVLQHALPQDVRATLRQRALLGFQVAQSLLEGHGALTRLLRLRPKLGKRLLLLALQVRRLAGLSLQALHLRVEGVGALRELLLLLVDF
mmetsp:Transcript_65288/g.169651  ORF Transcript_65288/g.169651 Transcript_65288/m.169651 type:complete len:300 (-) Transcript_65288:2675-3574(-)